MKIATFLPNMTDVQEPEQEELNENHIPPKLRALPVSAVLHLAKPRRMGKARKKIITPLRSLRKNLATLAVPYLPSSVPKSPLAPRTKGYRPQLRSSDFLLPYFLICLLYPYMPYMVKKLWGLGYLAPEPVEGSLSKGACRRELVEGSLSKGAWCFLPRMFPSRKAAKDARSKLRNQQLRTSVPLRSPRFSISQSR